MHPQIKDLLVTNSFFIFGLNLFAPLYALYIQGIDPSIHHVGGVWAFYIICMGCMVYVVSKFENHIKYADYFLILGFLGRTIGWIGYIFVTNIAQVYLIQIFLAAGEALGTPAYNTLYSLNLDKGKAASEWGLSASINAFIMGLAAWLGSWIVGSFGFPVLFVFMTILSLVSVVLALRYRRALGTVSLLRRPKKD
ncbi:MAG TPA: MFS transporter [Candidatus Nanoarchaeia archaeon]|nr:MFS transporter [Candidatus Nanoarchaeia archaeon]